MYDAARRPKLMYSLATIGAVWLFATAAGVLPGLFPWNAGAQMASLLLYTTLLAGYARWTEAGRRSAGAYFLGGFLVPVICIALLVALDPVGPDSFFAQGGEAVFAGLNVGFQFHGGADTPLEAYLPLMWANLLLSIAAVIGGRSFVRYHGKD